MVVAVHQKITVFLLLFLQKKKMLLLFKGKNPKTFTFAT
jgi:hypothetical protein